MAAQRIIGVDFGTSTSVIRVKRYEGGKPAGGSAKLDTCSVIFNGMYPAVPTVIQRVGDNTYYGYDALISRKKARTHQGFKVKLESNIQQEREEARALTEEFLGYLGRCYREQSEGGHLGEPDDQERTLISYPVKWSEETKKFMIQAAEKAGFPNVEGMDEAQAAVHAATLQCETYLQNQGYLEPGQTCTILLIDMGAGTTDLVLCRYTPGEKSENEILCTWPRKGDVLFGGQETDDLLRSFVQNRLPEEASLILKNFGNEKFKAWKENLVSPALLRGDEVDGFADLDSSLMMLGLDVGDYGLNRAVFERWAGEYLKGLPQLVRGCIQESGISPSEVELVVLTGGHSQWYFAKEILTGRLPAVCGSLLPQITEDPNRILSVTRPQETVALGLVYTPLSAELKPDGKSVSSVKAGLDEKNTSSVKDGSDGKDIFSAKAGPDLEELGKRFDIYESRRAGRDNIQIVAVDAKGILQKAELKMNGSEIAEDTQILADNWDRYHMCSSVSGEAVQKAVKEIAALSRAGRFQLRGQELWSDIVKVVNYDYGAEVLARPFGLKKDGTVVTVKYYEKDSLGNLSQQRKDRGLWNVISQWKEITDIDYKNNWLTGWRKDRSCVLLNDNGEEWKYENSLAHEKVRAIDASLSMAAAILENGMVKIIPSGGRFADRELIQKLISQTASWGNIEKIFCLQNTVAGIRRNGTVAIAGRRTEEAERELYQWSEISSIAVSPGGGQMLGLRKDGRVEGTGILKEQIREWRDILVVKLYQQAGGGKETLCAAGVRKNGDLIYSICVISYNSGEKKTKGLFFRKAEPVPPSVMRQNGLIKWKML